MISKDGRDAIAHVRDDVGTLVLRSIGTLRPKPLAGILFVLFALLCFAHPAHAQGSEPAVTVSFGQAAYSVQENGAVDATVTLSQDPERQVVIPLSVTNQGGATAADYSGVPASVTFESGETSRSFTFSAAYDSDDDDGESVSISFGTTLPDNVSEGSPASTTVSIAADTTAPTFVSATTSEDGVQVSVTFSEDVTVIPLVATLAEQYGISTGMIVKVLFNVTVAGNGNLMITSSYSGPVVTLRLEGPRVRTGQEVAVRYDNVFTEAPGGVLTDLAGNALARFGEQTVTNASVDASRWVFIDPPVLSKSKLYICEGDTATYGVKLPSQPTGNVGLSVLFTPHNVVFAQPEYMTFTPDNWDTYQTITVYTDEDGYTFMPDGVSAFWGATAHRISGVSASDTYDNIVRILVRDSAHADCSG